jgi:hypothetical protein
MATATTLLLPEREHLAGQRLPPDLAQWLARADRATVDGSQYRRLFDVLPRGWPVAAATRQREAGDAAYAAWLRADPVFVQPDMNGARLMAYGEALSLTAEDADALLPALKPMFGDTGFPIDAATPSHWYLRLPLGAKLPAFTSPDQALGADFFDHLPAGSEGRRWRALLSEAQVVLHNHPRNAARIARGLPPVNSLWFWGAGTLPDHVRCDFSQVCSDDEAVQAFAALAGLVPAPLPARWPAGEGAVGGDGHRAFDLRHARDLAGLHADWFAPAMADIRAGRLDAAILDFADGVRYTLDAHQRWRFWRRPLRALSPDLSPA